MNQMPLLSVRNLINLGLIIIIASYLMLHWLIPEPRTWQLPSQMATWEYTFSQATVLEESGRPEQSANPYWWLNSGAYFFFDGRVGRTVQGVLPSLDKWQRSYNSSNPMDTDNGYRPQNIFRLFTQNLWYNSRAESDFRIIRYNDSASPRHNASNGISLISRFQNNEDLYSASMRVDGSAILKKKIEGQYYELAYRPDAWTPGEITGLPVNTWIGLAAETSDSMDGSVTLRLFVERGIGDWELVLEATDIPNPAIAQIKAAGRAGIRTDFMDVEMKDYRIIGL